MRHNGGRGGPGGSGWSSDIGLGPLPSTSPFLRKAGVSVEVGGDGNMIS